MIKTTDSSNISWVAALAVIAFLVFAYVFNAKPDLNGDNCYYYANATSLAQGKGYSDMFGNPTTNFPPGYPLLMAPVRLVTDSIVAQKVLNLLFLFAGVCLLFDVLVKLGFKRSLAFVMGVAVLVTPHLLEFSTMMMSEASCFCCLALIAWLYLRLPDSDESVWRSPLFYLFLLSVVFVYFIRTQAVAMLVACVIALLFARRWYRALAVIAAFIIGCLPWVIRNELLGLNQSRYVSQIDLSHVIDNFKMLVVQAVPESILPFVNVSYENEPGWGLWLFALLWLSVIIFGFCRMGKLRWVMILLVLGTFTIISVIDTPSRYRYITTILPFLTAGLLVGLWSLGNTIAERLGMRSFSPWFMLLLLVPMLTQRNNETKHTVWGLHSIAKTPFPPNYRNYFELGRQLYKYNKRAVVATRKPELLFVNSGIRGKHFLETEDQRVLIQDLVNKKIDFVVLDQLGFAATYIYLLPCVEQNPDLFRPVMNIPNPNTYLIQFDRKKAQEWLETH